MVRIEVDVSEGEQLDRSPLVALTDGLETNPLGVSIGE